MNASVSPPPSSLRATLDARILQLILKGQLRESSSISDGSGEPAQLLADHPRFSKVLQLARVHRSVGLLSNVEWWHAQRPAWTSTLQLKPLPILLFELSRTHQTGFLTLKDEDRIKVLAFASGVCLCVNSNLKREQLLETAEALGKDPGALKAAAEMHAQHQDDITRPLEWALLQSEAMSVDDLLALRQQQGRAEVLDLFSWRSADVHFYPDERASQLEPVLMTPLVPLLERGTWGHNLVPVTRLRTLCEPLLSSAEALAVQQPLGTLEFQLSPVQKRLYGLVKDGRPPTDLTEELEALPEEQALEGWQFVYLFTTLGVIGVDGPEFLQPILAPLEEEDAGLSPFDPLELSGVAPRLTTSAGLPQVDEVPAAAVAEGTESTAQRMTGPRELQEYKLQLQLEQEGRSLLNNAQYNEAVAKFTQLSERQDKPTSALAYLSVATLLARKPAAPELALRLAQRAYELDSEDALAVAAMARALEGVGKKHESFERRALQLSHQSDAWFREVRALLDVGKVSKRLKQRRAQRTMAAAAGLAAISVVGLFVASNILGLGKEEYFYSGQDPFFYVRRGVLLVAGLLGILLIRKTDGDKPFAPLQLRTSTSYILAALVVGLAVGFFSPPQRVTGGLSVVLGLTALHVVAEEVFFRGLITQLLLRHIADWQQAVFVSAVIFGAYHLSFYSFWEETALIPKFYWCAMVAMFAGIPYALLYYKSRSITPPLLCHAVVNGIMMTVSVLNS